MKIELDKEVDAAPTEFTVKLASESPRAAKGIDSFVRMALYVTDEVGNKVRSTEYDPFGNWHKAQGQANIHMLFQGQQQDPESSLYYMRARYYDPFIGRFISRDPIKGSLLIPKSQNSYQYAYNNPIIMSDPSGLVVYNNSDQYIVVKEENEKQDTYQMVAPHKTYGGEQDGVIFNDGSVHKNNDGVDLIVNSNGKVGYATPLDAVSDQAQNGLKYINNNVPGRQQQEYSGSYRLNDGSTTGNWNPNMCW
jgi:RHS repeat-associated protein